MIAISPMEVSGKFSHLLYQVTRHLPVWLESRLPPLDSRWWETLVLPSLSFHQREKVERTHTVTLQQLDLAALLRIIDQNWYLLSQRYAFSSQDRHFVKEMQTIRNRWAHLDAHGISTEDAYRDADTLQRFAKFVGLPDPEVMAIGDFKRQLIAERRQEPAAPTPSVLEVSISKAETDEIVVGSLVTLVSDPSKQGAVIAIDSSSTNTRYTVFIDGRPQPFYSAQLNLVTPEPPASRISLPELHSVMTGMQINHPTLSNLYSLNAARIEFVPYQFRPALKIIRADQPRILIADGVGVGKTIEAGLIIKELQARNKIESVLIICPKPLVAERKWELEMRRFDERFVALDGKTLRHCIQETDEDGEWPEAYRKAILPYSLLDEKILRGQSDGNRSNLGLIDLDPAPRFDLVIVDEAHHVRNSSTFAHQAVQYFCDNAEAVVFLTATPIQLGNRDLFTLLNLLRPDLIIDEESFIHMSEPNPFINEALRHVRSGDETWQAAAHSALQQALETPWGTALLSENPEFREVCRRLSDSVISREERVALSRKVETFHSFSRLINRTRRRDIDTFCIRRPETLEVSFTDKQQALHDALLEFEAEALSRLHGNQNVKFMMTTLRRQAASCIFGLAPFISSILDRRLGQLELTEADGDDLPSPMEFGALSSKAEAIRELARQLPEEDPKFEAFRQVIDEKLSMSNRKVIVFSGFRHTLAYLEQRLAAMSVRVGVIHGDIDDAERLALRKRFESDGPDALDVMLFSEVGCEGLDYQFCDTLINYDLPWNPMRIEQRIGRIDRRGQKSEAVAIYNLITPGTVEADIYHRCLLRIGIFEESIGECEEILGDLHKEIRAIAESLSLSDEDKRRKLEQLADNEIRKMQEQRELEDREHELFGVSLPKLSVDDEVQASESYWLAPASLQRFVSHYLQSRLGAHEYLLGDKPLKTLRVSTEGRGKLLEDFRALKPQKSPVNRAWETWLKTGDPHHPITFDAKCATDHAEAFFITSTHPLVRQAARHIVSPEPVHSSFRISDPSLPPGDYPFAIYAWEYRGINPKLELVPICQNPDVRENFFKYLEAGVDHDMGERHPSDSATDGLDRAHHDLWSQAKETYGQETREICAYKKESLRTSHQARLNVLKGQLDRAADEKIHRMKLAQIANVKREYESQLQLLERAEATVDIHTRPVVFGVVTVEG